MKTERVTVGFLHPGHYAACFAESLKELLFHDLANNQRIVSHAFGQLAKECGSGGIVEGRNKLAQAMCDESEADWLFMVDSDMGFAPDTVERLLAVADRKTRPVVGALAFAHKTDGRGEFGTIRYLAQPTLYDIVELDDRIGVVPRFDYPRDEVVQVAATGGACVLIHRSAFLAIRAKYGDVWFDQVRHPKGAHFSEDLSFCIRLAACGIEVHVDTSIKTTHDKGGVFLDEAYYDAHRKPVESA
jgi:GT2 family glycosyltransferase